MEGKARNHRDYVRHYRFRKKMIHLEQILLLFILLGLWEGAARIGWLNDFIFSSPSRIVRCAVDMASDGTLFIHIGTTLLETVASFLIVTVIGILAAILLWMFRSLSEVLEPYLVMLNSLPKSALAPVLIVWLGNNTKTIIVAAVSVAIFGSIITLYTSFREIDPNKIKLIQVLGGNRLQIMTKVLLPGSIPTVISNMKVNIGLCLVGVIIGEFLASKQGLGYLIIYGSQVFKMDWVMMSIVILCIVAMCLYKLVNILEKLYRKRM
ncbi:MAG: ABC transporter permease [Lachnospiraceae bacterium]|nr:ABC transporter permease [Candidatus Fimimorpha excrementavium]